MYNFKRILYWLNYKFSKDMSYFNFWTENSFFVSNRLKSFLDCNVAWINPFLFYIPHTCLEFTVTSFTILSTDTVWHGNLLNSQSKKTFSEDKVFIKYSLRTFAKTGGDVHGVVVQSIMSVIYCRKIQCWKFVIFVYNSIVISLFSGTKNSMQSQFAYHEICISYHGY